MIKQECLSILIPAIVYATRVTGALCFAAVLCAPLALTACSGSPEPEICTRGTIGCACEADQCDDGLACSEGMCFAQGAVTLQVPDPRARGCEVLLVEDGSEIVSVEFGDRVRGTHVREAPKTAVVFIATGDQAIADGQVTVRFKDDGLAAPRARAVHCIDENGAPIDGAKVEIRG